MDVSFNLPSELDVTRTHFQSADGAEIVPIILCDYPSSKGSAIRAVTIDADTMNQISDTCRDQGSASVVDAAITECYTRITLDEMIDITEMRLV